MGVTYGYVRGTLRHEMMIGYDWHGVMESTCQLQGAWTCVASGAFRCPKMGAPSHGKFQGENGWFSLNHLPNGMLDQLLEQGWQEEADPDR